METDRYFKTSWVDQLLTNLQADDTLEPHEKFQKLCDLLKDKAKKPAILLATDASIAGITRLFGLRTDKIDKSQWTLREEHFDVPKRLEENLADIGRLRCRDTSEATGRLAIGLMLLACESTLRDSYPQAFPSEHLSSTSARASTSNASISTITATLRPQLDIGIVVTDVNGTKVHVKGRVDWGFGYGDYHSASMSTFPVAIVAKTREQFFQAEPQLLAYLAILGEQQRRAGEIDCTVQGFFTDGNIYRFMSISDDGEVRASDLYFVQRPGHMKTVFNFIMKILVSALWSAPPVTLTKPGLQRDNEIARYEKIVWADAYGGEQYIGVDKSKVVDMPDFFG